MSRRDTQPSSAARTPGNAPERRVVRTGVIGCGDFGSGIVAQAASAPGLEVFATADRDLERARAAYRSAGVPDETIAACSTRAEALAAIEAGKRVITEDPLLLIDLPLDVVAEATGHPESGARHAEAAIRNGRHVAMVTKEADVVVGPILRRLADRAGVVYTPVDGDQHGLLIGMVAWARRLGLEVLCGGKPRDQEITWDTNAGTIRSGPHRMAVPDGAGALDPLPLEPGDEARALRTRHIEARLDQLGAWGRIGGWDLVELTIAANATGLAFDVPFGVHCPAVYTAEIPWVLCPEEIGGILGKRGAVDAVTCLRMPHEAGMGGGVFIVVSAATQAARDVLRGGSVCTNGDGTAALITRPYHLLGVEAINSMLDVATSGSCASADEYMPRYDVLVRAARDLPEGTVLGDDHSPETEPFVGAAAPVADGRPLPLHLANGNRLRRSVPRGTVITRDMVAAPAGSALWALRAQQDAVFHPSTDR